ncbi:MAG: hypothetical protein GYA02_04495 [Clostridiaceae bacterium]|jgi:hypothetical protein|nr:hypothetical protein [Clostridiaceae bacterium]
MEKKDRFASIALETRIQNKAELEEISPVPLDNNLVFEASSYTVEPIADSVEPITDKTWQEQLEQFRKELHELKEKYRPF